MKLLSDVPITREDIEEILDCPISWNDEEEERLVTDLVQQLTEEEIETAAQGSYAYWLATVSSSAAAAAPPPKPEQRMRMTLREARRHTFKVPYDQAAQAIKETCKYRRDRRIDLIRACFQEGVEYDDTDDSASKAMQFRAAIESDLRKQAAFIRGSDKDGHALLISRARLEPGTDDEEFVLAQIYLMERAIACTEFLTKGKLGKIVVVFDFGDFSASLSPSWSALKVITTILQHHYPERLYKLFVIDAPFWMRTTWNLLKPFVHEETQQKWVVGNESKEIFSDLVSDENAMPFVVPSGKLSEPVDQKRFLEDVPFCYRYDDV